MSEAARRFAADVDAGTECVKAMVIDRDGRTLGRAVTPTRGHFAACAHEALAAAMDDAQVLADELIGIGATGFGMATVTRATHRATESTCHALGAFHRVGLAMTLVNIGGRDPEVIHVDAGGRRIDARGGRGCAVGIGSFLAFAARHLDVSETRLDELASASSNPPAPVTSYCSVFSATAVLERLREGVSREDIALGCIHSIAERIVEIGGFEDPVMISGGVAEYFPSVLRVLESLSGRRITALPEPIYTGALGAGLLVLDAAAAERRTDAAGASR